MPLSERFVTDFSAVELLFIIVLGWTLVALWQRWIDNLTFNTLKLSKDSTYQTFIIAVVVTILYLVFLYSFETIFADINIDSDQPLNPPGSLSFSNPEMLGEEDENADQMLMRNFDGVFL